MTNTCGDHGGTNRRGEPCGQPEGWGTDFETGKCRNHRGTSPDGKSHEGNQNARKHGAFSELFRSDLREDEGAALDAVVDHLRSIDDERSLAHQVQAKRRQSLPSGSPPVVQRVQPTPQRGRTELDRRGRWGAGSRRRTERVRWTVATPTTSSNWPGGYTHASEVGWETQDGTSTDFGDLPPDNKSVMVRTASALLYNFDIERRE